MALQPLPGFKAHTTHHCVTGSIYDIYQYHGYDISEDMLLGIGAGVGFAYFQMKGIPPILGGRANMERPGVEGLEKAIGRRTGVKVEIFRTGSARKAETALLELLAAGEPVAVGVDMAYLPYFDFGGEEFHFGGHVIAIGGYDAETWQVLVADRDGVLYPVSMEALAKARGSKFKPFPPQNVWLTFDFSGSHAVEPDEVKQAIREAVAGMLQPPIANFGVKGIRKAAKRVLGWPQEMTDKELRDACFSLYIFVDAAGGTGGGLFRYMYGRFLKEAAALTGDDRLADVGEQMRAIGDRWQEIAVMFPEAATIADPAARLQEASAILNAIADCEQAAWEQLERIVG